MGKDTIARNAYRPAMLRLKNVHCNRKLHESQWNLLAAFFAATLLAAATFQYENLDDLAGVICGNLNIDSCYVDIGEHVVLEAVVSGVCDSHRSAAATLLATTTSLLAARRLVAIGNLDVVRRLC